MTRPASEHAREIEAIKERAVEILRVLDSGSEPFADSGYGYEHMGDMARDVRPLCEAVVALASTPASALAVVEQERDQLREALTDFADELDAEARDAQDMMERVVLRSTAQRLRNRIAALAVPSSEPAEDDPFCPHGIPYEFCGNCHDAGEPEA